MTARNHKASKIFNQITDGRRPQNGALLFPDFNRFPQFSPAEATSLGRPFSQTKTDVCAARSWNTQRLDHVRWTPRAGTTRRADDAARPARSSASRDPATHGREINIHNGCGALASPTGPLISASGAICLIRSTARPGVPRCASRSPRARRRARRPWRIPRCPHVLRAGRTPNSCAAPALCATSGNPPLSRKASSSRRTYSAPTPSARSSCAGKRPSCPRRASRLAIQIGKLLRRVGVKQR